MSSSVSNRIQELRSRVFLKELPDDFLRINATIQQQQEAADRQTALALQQQFVGPHNLVPKIVGRLGITVLQAKLTKNYGMTRMDPYARIRVGHCVYETNTDSNGGKNPRWNKVLHCLLPHGVTSIAMEIYDERNFTVDELIAWTQIKIPPQVLSGETHEAWYPLTGKQGDGAEGSINLVLSFMPPASGYYYPASVTTGTEGMRPNIDPAAASITFESDLKMIEEMFPTVDKDVVKSVFVANRNNKDETINSLLQMCE